MKLGVVSGLKFETEILRRIAIKKNLEPPFFASVAGRQDKSYEAAKAHVERGAKALISFGIAGGLTDDVPVGTLVLADEVYCGKGSRYKTDAKWRDALAGLLQKELTAVTGPVISLTYALETEEQKRGANRETGALGVDMESFGVARAAREAGVPFLVIRSVSDAAADLLPSCIVPAMAPDGGINIGPILRGIAEKPGDLPHLIGFGLKTRKANATLRRVGFLGLPFFGLR